MTNIQRPRLHLSLPATSANLGPAFDAAALAFDLHLEIDARADSSYSVTASGRDSTICGQLEHHLILETYREVLAGAGKPETPLALRIKNEIPIGKGCGSSAAARLAGIALAVHFADLRWNDGQMVGEASRREHHPDNAAACWMGGFAVARMASDSEAQVACIRPKGKWPLLLAVPPQSLSTEAARRVLPRTYSRADAVANIQHSMLLVAAFVQGRRDLLASAMHDRIHQPYRASLCPLLPALDDLNGQPGILGAALSGAGPSVLIFLDPEIPPRRTADQVRAHLKTRSLRAELLPATIVERGARHDWLGRKSK